MKKIKQILTPEKRIPIFLILLNAIVFWRWFVFGIVTSGDWLFQYPKMLTEFIDIPRVWTAGGLGSVNLGLSSWPSLILHGLFGLLGFDSGLSSKFVVMLPLVVLTPTCIYILAKKILKNDFGSITASIVYSYNTYFMLGRTGHLTLMLVFAIAPLCLYFYIVSLEKLKLRPMVAMALTSFVMSAYDARGTYILGLILLGYSIFWLSQKYDKPETMRKGIQLILIGLGLVGILNLYWAIGAFATGSLTTNSIFNRGLFGDGFMNLRQSVALFHPFWTAIRPTDFIVQPIPGYFWLIPASAFLGWFLNRRLPMIQFFAFVALAGVFLSKQSDLPLPQLYLWLYNHFPGFNAFRESSKFFFVSSLGYSILIGALITKLHKLKTKSFISAQTWAPIMASIWLIFLINIVSFINGEIRTIFIPKSIPNDYLIYKDFISKQSDSFRVFWVPQSSRWAIADNDHPNISASELLKESDLFTSKIDNSRQRMLNNLSTPYFANQLALYNVKYIAVPTQDLANDDNFFKYFGLRRDVFINFLNAASYLKPLDIGTSELKIYQNLNYHQPVFALDHLYGLNSSEDIDTKYHSLAGRSYPFNFASYLDGNLPLDYLLDSSFLANNANPTLLNSITDLFKDGEVSGCGPKIAKYFEPDTAPGSTINTNPSNGLRVSNNSYVGCTTRQLPGILPNKSYIISFRINGDKVSQGGVSIEGIERQNFKKIPATSPNKRISVLFKTSDTSENVALTLFSIGGIIDYSDFVLKEVNDPATQLYPIDKTSSILAKPRSISLEKNGITSKTINITGAREPFFLALSESYHPKWSLRFGNIAMDNAHFSLNDSINGWYIDPMEVCKSAKKHCTAQPDGTWDIKGSIRLTSQKMLNIATFISLGTLVGCIYYLWGEKGIVWAKAKLPFR